MRNTPKLETALFTSPCSPNDESIRLAEVPAEDTQTRTIRRKTFATAPASSATQQAAALASRSVLHIPASDPSRGPTRASTLAEAAPITPASALTPRGQATSYSSDDKSDIDSSSGNRWVAMLRTMFDELSAGQPLDIEDFLRYFPLPGVLGERLFALFDRDGSGSIDFDEFFVGLCVIYNGSSEQRRRFLFDLYDLDGSGLISQAECLTLLRHIPAALDALRYVATIRTRGTPQVSRSENHSFLEPLTRSVSAVSPAPLDLLNLNPNKGLLFPGICTTAAAASWTPENHRPTQQLPYSRSTSERLIASQRDYDQRIARIIGEVFQGRDGITFPEFSAALDSNAELAHIMNLFHGLGMRELPVPTAALQPELLNEGFFAAQLRRLRHRFAALLPPSRTVFPFMSNGSDMEGWLRKLGKTFSMTHQRYFVLKDQFLYCHKRPGIEPCRVMFVQGADVRPMIRGGSGRMWGLQLTLPSGRARFTLFAPSRQARDLWVERLTHAAQVASIHAQYQLMSPRGQGRFAVVHRAVVKETQENVAIKIIPKFGAEERAFLRNEVTAMRLLRHPNIVQLRDVCHSTEFTYLVMEWMSGGDVGRVVRCLDRHKHHTCDCNTWAKWVLGKHGLVTKWRLCERLALIVARGVMQGLSMLHSNGIVHRDIKPENILVVRAEDLHEHVDPCCLSPCNADEEANTCAGCSNCPLCMAVRGIIDVKLGDFGLAKILPPAASTSEQLGTLAYAAPEVVEGLPYTQQVDLWGAGIVIYQVLAAGKLPFDEEEQEAVMLAQTPINCDLEHYGDDAKDFLKGLLLFDASSRRSADDCLLHPWLTANTFD